MCSYFWQRMEGDQGDLGDIIRGSGCSGAPTAAHQTITTDWQLPQEPVTFPSSLEAFNDGYGDALSGFRDPLLHELAGTTFFDSPDSTAGFIDVSMVGDDGGSAVAGGGGSLATKKVLGGEEMKRPCDIFSRVLQISPRAIKPPHEILIGDMVKVNSGSGGCPLDQSGLQISSPRTPGIKRRKSQAKKVVCIPAPAAASSRPGGEVVPSDLWAWRKYGQKPIKGSPYPRGYYRCSSSKGCSARKQVERSRTDPNMLVITYTSEHNHPWPTQRNALAGSTRSQPAKSNSSATRGSPRSQRPTPPGASEEQKGPGSMASPPPIKEEAAEMEKLVDAAEEQDFDQVFDQNYKAMLLDSNQPGDFFADLGELESDPLSLVFSKEFLGDKCDDERENKATDPFTLFDWAGSSFGETRKGGL